MKITTEEQRALREGIKDAVFSTDYESASLRAMALAETYTDMKDSTSRFSMMECIDRAQAYATLALANKVQNPTTGGQDDSEKQLRRAGVGRRMMDVELSDLKRRNYALEAEVRQGTQELHQEQARSLTAREFVLDVAKLVDFNLQADENRRIEPGKLGELIVVVEQAIKATQTPSETSKPRQSGVILTSNGRFQGAVFADPYQRQVWRCWHYHNTEQEARDCADAKLDYLARFYAAKAG